MNTKKIAEEFDSEAYLKALTAVAMADGEIAPEEMTFIEVQAKLLALDLEKILKAPEQNLRLITPKISLKTKKVILRDCISMAHMDGKYSSIEQTKVLEIAQDLGLGSQDVEELEKWLLDYWKILERGSKILGDAG